MLFLREENPALRDNGFTGAVLKRGKSCATGYIMGIRHFPGDPAPACGLRSYACHTENCICRIGQARPDFRVKAVAGKLKPYLRLIIGIFFLWLGGSVMNASLIFTFEHILQMPRSAFLKFVLLQYLIGIACLPLWVRFGNRFGRHRALFWGGFGYLAVQPLYLLVTPGEFSQLLLVALIHGPIISVIWVMPPALIADTIEYGMMKGGGDDAAIYMAVYNFMVKIAFAGGVGIALPLLSVFGFQAAGENSEPAIRGLIFVGLFLPAVIGVAGAVLLYNYPINKHRHGVIRRWLTRKNLSPEIR